MFYSSHAIVTVVVRIKNNPSSRQDPQASTSYQYQQRQQRQQQRQHNHYEIKLAHLDIHTLWPGRLAS